MLTVQEIFYLNAALEGKEIHGFSYNKTMVELLKQGKTFEDVRTGLIKKEYLDKEGNLNIDSYEVIRNLDIYKKAEKYITINKIFGAMDKSDFITFFQEADNDEYNFKKTTKELLILAMVKEFEFLREYREVDECETSISFEEITEKLAAKSLSEAIYVRKGIKNNVEIYNIYFFENERTYKYNVLQNTLRGINPKDIIKEFVDILEVGAD